MTGKAGIVTKRGSRRSRRGHCYDYSLTCRGLSHCMWTVCAALFVGTYALASDSASFHGQPVLDDAVAIKLAARTRDDYGLVLELCRKALNDGLGDADASFAAELYTATLVERAGFLVNAAEQGSANGDEWTGLRDAAKRDIEEAVARDGGLGNAYLLLARSEVLPGGDRHLARVAADKAVALLGDESRMLAQANLVLGQLADDPTRQVECFDKAVRLMPTEPILRRARGLSLLDRGDYRLAREDLRLALASTANDRKLQEAFAMACIRDGDAAEAIAAVSKAIEAMPLASGLYEIRAQAHARLGDRDLARVDVDRAIELSPESVSVRLFRARLVYETGNTGAAVEDIEVVLASAPDNSEALELKARICEGLGDFDEAIWALRKLVSSHPGQGQYLLSLGELFLRAGQPDEARRRFTRAIEFDDMRQGALVGRSQAAAMQGDYKSAAVDLEQAYEECPENAFVANNLAWLLATSPADAVRNGGRAVSLANNACQQTAWTDWRTVSTLAAAYAEQGDFEAAQRYAQRAMAVSEEAFRAVEEQLAAYRQRRSWRDHGTSHEGVLTR